MALCLTLGPPCTSTKQGIGVLEPYHNPTRNDSANDDWNLNFEFRHNLLDAVQYELPLFFVNYEARRIALAWVGEHDIEIRTRELSIELHACNDRRSSIFVRHFNPLHDVLYIALDQWDEFFREPYDRSFQPNLVEKLINQKSAQVTRIAVPEVLLLRSEVAAAFTERSQDEHFSQLEILMIVIDTQPDLQRRWELDSTQGEVFLWNNHRSIFEIRDSENISNQALYRLLGEVNKGLGEELFKKHIRSFKIQPVFAVRR